MNRDGRFHSLDSSWQGSQLHRHAGAALLRGSVDGFDDANVAQAHFTWTKEGCLIGDGASEGIEHHAELQGILRFDLSC